MKIKRSVLSVLLIIGLIIIGLPAAALAETSEEQASAEPTIETPTAAIEDETEEAVPTAAVPETTVTQPDTAEPSVPLPSTPVPSPEVTPEVPPTYPDGMVSYQAHVKNKGWLAVVKDGEMGGTEGENKRMEAIRIQSHIEGVGIEYKSHIQNIGWETNWTIDNKVSGTEGRALQLEAIQIQLTGEKAAEYHVYYQVHIANIGWTKWAQNGEIAGSSGYAYQMEAIRIVIVKEGEVAPGETGQAYFQKPVLSYAAHVQDIGWQSPRRNGGTAGTTGQAKQMEALKIDAPIIDGYDVGIEYRSHVANIGWQEYVSNGAVSGTEGKGLAIEAVQIRLTGADADQFDVYYQLHIKDYGWLDWTKNDGMAGSEGIAKRVEAMTIVVKRKGESAPGSMARAFVTKPTTQYATHVEDIGWQSYVGEGAISGTVGQAKRIEAIVMGIDTGSNNININYRSHVQNDGWHGWVGSGSGSGTTNQGKRLEAIQIALVGSDASKFNVYYQVHVQNFGWMGWAKNGESAGSAGYGYRMEAIRVVIQPKEKPAPGSTANAYREAPKRQSPDYGVGNTFIEINIAAQRLTYYQNDNVVVQTPVVTGCVSRGYGTPRGIYTLRRKAMNVDLTGSGYVSHVNYWMPFIGEEYGMHDASWRDSFGGDIYWYDGSHGCVNMPSNEAARLYYHVSVGTPVVIV